MNASFIEHSVRQFADDVRSAGRTLGQMASCLEVHYLREIEDYEEQLKIEFQNSLDALGRRLPALLDLLGMSDTRESFLASWSEVSDDLGATVSGADDYGLYLVSKPYQMLNDISQALGAGYSDSQREDQRLAASLEILECVLHSIPQILKARGIVPAREADVQAVLHHHLECTFPTYSRKVSIPKGPKSFEPDGAIPSLQVAIELKFADSKRKAVAGFSAVKEDLSGYGGSRDWTRFYSVLYQTDAFIAGPRFDKSLRLSGNAARWKVIVVTGSSDQGKLSAQTKT